MSAEGLPTISAKALGPSLCRFLECCFQVGQLLLGRHLFPNALLFGEALKLEGNVLDVVHDAGLDNETMEFRFPCKDSQIVTASLTTS
jgi:hypothetical protein